jgi:hypothetical protein
MSLQAIGVFTVAVWPVYVGVQDIRAIEPWTYLDYERAQIVWETAGQKLHGRTKREILVPAGTFTHLVFTHQPASPLLCAITPLDHPFVFHEPSAISLKDIVQEDFTTRAEQPHDTLARLNGGL